MATPSLFLPGISQLYLAGLVSKILEEYNGGKGEMPAKFQSSLPSEDSIRVGSHVMFH